MLMILFLITIAFGIYGLLKQTGDGEEETEKKPVSVKKAEKAVYEIGENVETGDIVCNVSEANIIENFSELDAYYQKGSYLISQEEYAKDIYSTHSVFPEEIHFLHIKFSLTNNGDKKRSFSPADLNLCSILDKDAAPIWPWKSFIVFDRQYMTQNGKKSEVKFSGQKLGNTNMVSEDISIQKGETIVVEFVGEFQEYEGNKSFYDYNLYLPIYDTGRKIITDPLGQKIHLNLERRYKGEKKTEEPVLYAEIRDIAAMKSRSWTNSELAEGQKGYFRHENIQEKVLQHEEGGEEYSQITNQEWRGKELVQSYIKVIQALDYQVTDWENIPEDFAEQGNIENMAKRYNEVYGYKKEDLKVLFLDIIFSADSVGKKYENGELINFYECSNLFTADSDGKWCVFGTADDWTVLSDSKNPENTGRLDVKRIVAEDNVTVRMAYILPPDFYQETDALYYGGGEFSPLREDMVWTKIELK